jgi:Type I restriction modification DNA specificity domain
MVPLSDVFDIEYGNKFDANKANFQPEGINFVSRSSKNLGVVGKVEEIDGATLFEAGLITVTLGGTYLLSAFVQPERFYTAQNIKVLRPKEPMAGAEKIYFCECIRANRFKFSTHGREANRSLHSIMVPSRSDVPQWLKFIKPKKFSVRADHKLVTPAEPRDDQDTKYVRLDTIFDVKNGTLVSANDRSEFRDSDDYMPYIRPSKLQSTSFVEYVNRAAVEEKFLFPRHTLYVSTNGQGSHTYSYVSTEWFVPNTDVSPLIPKRSMSLQEKLYYSAVITAHRPLFSYGRKPKGERLKSLLIPQWAPKFIYEEDLIGAIAA